MSVHLAKSESGGWRWFSSNNVDIKYFHAIYKWLYFSCDYNIDRLYSNRIKSGTTLLNMRL